MEAPKVSRGVKIGEGSPAGSGRSIFGIFEAHRTLLIERAVLLY